MENKNLQIVMYKPEIAQNVGAALRLCACMKATLHLIAPFGFILDKHRLFPLSEERRSFLDYWNKCIVILHDSWEDFVNSAHLTGSRLIGLTPHTEVNIHSILPGNKDILVFGRESDGLDEKVHSYVDILAHIPMASNCRSLNVCTAMAMAMGFWQ